MIYYIIHFSKWKWTINWFSSKHYSGKVALSDQKDLIDPHMLLMGKDCCKELRIQGGPKIDNDSFFYKDGTK